MTNKRNKQLVAIISVQSVIFKIYFLRIYSRKTNIIFTKNNIQLYLKLIDLNHLKIKNNYLKCFQAYYSNTHEQLISNNVYYIVDFGPY